MDVPIILASGSQIRAQLLTQAGVPFKIVKPRVDEAAVRDALLAEQARPRDIADALAELKAQRVGAKQTDALTIGCDQVLALGDRLFSKPRDETDAFDQLCALRGKVHHLVSAAVIYLDGQPQWRHVGVVRLHMRAASDAYLSDYVARNWDSIRYAVGAYKLEEEGVRLFTRIEGDYFHVLGMPLLEILSYLTLRGTLPE